MTTDTVRDVAELTAIHRDTDARELALGAYDQLLDQLRRLSPDDWRARTDCPAWDVADMVGHMIGAARSNASVRELVRQQVRGKLAARHHDGNALDAVNALQVREHADLDPAERIATLAGLAQPAVEGRLGTPGLVRRVTLPMDQTGDTPPGTPTTLAMDRLVDVVYTRDVWLHTVDIERATGVAVDRTTGPTARVVEDVVREWAQRHGRPFELVLTGPGGGRFRQGEGGPTLALDAVECCRVLSGRAPGDGLLAQRVIF